MKNTGRTYESLVEDVFMQIHKQSSVQNITVEKNKKLPGKSTTHEIDVYWEFMVGNIKYATVIQAKDWAQNVPQGELLKLKAILEDVPGQPRGVFVTKTGYQSGAIEVAKANGIILYELREPTEKDWEGKIKKIIITAHLYVPNIKTEIIPDQEWVQNEFTKLKLTEPMSFSIAKMEDELFIKNSDGTVWKSLRDVKLEEEAKIGMAVVDNYQVQLDMDSDKYIDTGNDVLPLIKIKSIKFTISVTETENQTIIDGTTMIGYILSNIIDNEIIKFDKNGTILASPEKV